jgi:addiction module RelE/StbE family toxin
MIKNLHVEFTSRFNKQRKAAPLDIKIALLEAIELFLEDPHSPLLRNHSLKEEYSGYNSIDVTGDWRALFKVRESDTQTVFTFHILGTHLQLYG